jgi:hypothetical protein
MLSSRLENDRHKKRNDHHQHFVIQQFHHDDPTRTMQKMMRIDDLLGESEPNPRYCVRKGSF